MITRGHLIGEVIDGLTTISQQVSTRCQLGLTDLNNYLEDFFKEYLNTALGLSLVNLNDERSNEPGLDLGDTLASMAFQVTSTRTSAKINKTLEVVAKLDNQFDKVVVLIVGKKQKTYSLDAKRSKKLGFTDKDIWDMDDLCRKTISLPLDRLQSLYELVRRDLARVRIELEIPDEDGNFATSISSYIESIPKPQFSDFKKYQRYQREVEEAFEHSVKDIAVHFKEFARRLAALPRITREVYAFLVERREMDEKLIPEGLVYYSECVWFNRNKLLRICKFPDLQVELDLLDEHGFIDVWEPVENNQSPFIRIFALGKVEGFIHELIGYIENQGVGYKKPIVSLDFSGF
ncbi:SMEK domain-containing protein [Pseudomonas sp. SDO524_S393]